MPEPAPGAVSHDARARYLRWRSRFAVAHVVIWVAAWLIGGVVALALGYDQGALVGLIGGGFFALLSLIGWRRHRSL